MSARPDVLSGTNSEDDATSVEENVHGFNEEDGDVPDLHAARGLVPAIFLGAALWAVAFLIVVLLW
jgi:hypothetical protein